MGQMGRLSKQQLMKYKHKKEYLDAKIKWWEKQPESYKHATTRPGSVKTR